MTEFELKVLEAHLVHSKGVGAEAVVVTLAEFEELLRVYRAHHKPTELECRKAKPDGA